MGNQTADQEKYSREVEEILHRKPALVVRQGLLLMTLLVLLLLTGSWFIRYPERLTAPVTFQATARSDTLPSRGQVVLTAEAASLVRPGQPVSISLSPSPGRPPRHLPGSVGAMERVGNGEYCMVTILPDTSLSLAGSEGTVVIVTGRSRILSKILDPVLAVFRRTTQ